MENNEILLFLLTNVPGIVFSLIMGLGFGTFSTLAVYRLPRGMDWIGMNTRCLSCNHKLVLRDFFPILSWYLTKGKCRYCSAPIELRGVYFFVEIATTLLCVLCFIRFGFGDLYLLSTGLCVTAVIIMATDIEHRKIPNKPLIVLIMLGLMYRGLFDNTIFVSIEGGAVALIAALAVRHVWCYLSGRKELVLDYVGYEERDHFAGPGFDYVKLTVVAGAWLGAEGFMVFALLVLAGIAGMWPWRKALVKEGFLPLAIPLTGALIICVFLPGVIILK